MSLWTPVASGLGHPGSTVSCREWEGGVLVLHLANVTKDSEHLT